MIDTALPWPREGICVQQLRTRSGSDPSGLRCASWRTAVDELGARQPWPDATEGTGRSASPAHRCADELGWSASCAKPTTPALPSIQRSALRCIYGSKTSPVQFAGSRRTEDLQALQNQQIHQLMTPPVRSPHRLWERSHNPWPHRRRHAGHCQVGALSRMLLSAASLSSAQVSTPDAAPKVTQPRRANRRDERTSRLRSRHGLPFINDGFSKSDCADPSFASATGAGGHSSPTGGRWFLVCQARTATAAEQNAVIFRDQRSRRVVNGYVART